MTMWWHCHVRWTLYKVLFAFCVVCYAKILCVEINYLQGSFGYLHTIFLCDAWIKEEWLSFCGFLINSQHYNSATWGNTYLRDHWLFLVTDMQIQIWMLGRTRWQGNFPSENMQAFRKVLVDWIWHEKGEAGLRPAGGDMRQQQEQISSLPVISLRVFCELSKLQKWKFVRTRASRRRRRSVSNALWQRWYRHSIQLGSRPRWKGSGWIAPLARPLQVIPGVQVKKKAPILIDLPCKSLLTNLGPLTIYSAT